MAEHMRERIGRFEVVRRLGQGAMGEVFLARDPALGRQLAVKIIRQGTLFGEEAKARFEREARAAGSLNHPSIVTVFEFGEDQGDWYLAMEYVEGADLDSLIRAGQTPQAELLELLAQACDGLAYAHERGIVHRDIKPANILVSRTSRRPAAKLMDFGVALVAGSELTQQGSWMGTVNYMAPEYLDTGKAGPGSDLFALGVVLYEIVTGGRRPFSGETATSVLTAILHQPPAPFRAEEVQGLPPDLLTVANRALAKRPEDRYPGADALAEAIRQAMGGPAPSASLVPPEAELPDLVVARNGRGQFLSLRVALRQAPPGARIRVLAGVYRESLVLDKPVTLLGEGEVVLESTQGPCLTLQAPGIELANLLLQGVAGDPGPALAVNAGQVRVRECELRGSAGWAVRAAGPGLGFRDCTLQGGVQVAPQADVRLDGCRVQGTVEVEADARAELNGCQLEAGQVGVLVLERGQATLDHCTLAGHAWAAVHAVAEAKVQLRSCQVRDNPGYGVTCLGAGLVTLDACELRANGEPAVLFQGGATMQMTGCKVCEGQSFGVVCGAGGKGVLESCEVFGNARTGARVEAGGHLLLVRCDLHDGRDTGILLFEDAQVTLEECVVHRNARGGILLAKDAADPVLRGGGNRIQDALLRARGDGEVVKVTPVK